MTEWETLRIYGFYEPFKVRWTSKNFDPVVLWKGIIRSQLCIYVYWYQSIPNCLPINTFQKSNVTTYIYKFDSTLSNCMYVKHRTPLYLRNGEWEVLSKWENQWKTQVSQTRNVMNKNYEKLSNFFAQFEGGLIIFRVSLVIGKDLKHRYDTARNPIYLWFGPFAL